jgi:dTDP-4-dehydrorhamnose 3,5-epimerase
MIAERTPLEGLIVLTPRVFVDERGAFSETFNRKVFAEMTGAVVDFAQDNESVSRKHVLRGLHFQLPPKAQGKLVRVSKGAALDVAVDLRTASPTYGKHFSVELSGENRRQLWIPAGFAHGFLSLEEGTVFAYKCTDYYAPGHERTIAWNDPDLAIDWKMNTPIISAKDLESQDFRTFHSPF